MQTNIVAVKASERSNDYSDQNENDLGRIMGPINRTEIQDEYQKKISSDGILKNIDIKIQELQIIQSSCYQVTYYTPMSINLTNSYQGCPETLAQQIRQCSNDTIDKKESTSINKSRQITNHESQCENQFLSINTKFQKRPTKYSVAHFSLNYQKSFKADVAVKNIATKLFKIFSKNRGFELTGQIARTLLQKQKLKRDLNSSDYQNVYQSYQKQMVETCQQLAQRYMNDKNQSVFYQQSQGIIVPLKRLSGDVLPFYRILNALYGQPSINKGRPRVAIITDKGARVNQIKESFVDHQSVTNPFRILFDDPQRNQNITQQQKLDQLQKAIQENDVLVFKSRDFHECLMRGNLQIHNFDIIIFDDVHCWQLPDHPYNRIIQEFIYQNQNPRLLLPFIIGLTNFDNVFQETDTMSQITNRLMCYSNMLNANLAVLNESQAIRIMSDVCSDLNQIRWSFFKPSRLLDAMKDGLQFIATLNNNLVVGNQTWTQGTQIFPHQEIFRLKNQDSSIVQFSTKLGSKLTIKDGKRVFLDFLSTLNKIIVQLQDQIITIPFTVRIENVQYVCPQSKIRYFSSRLQLDKTMSCLLGFTNQIEWFYSKNFEENIKPLEGAVAPSNLFLFKKKLESEDHLYLQLCQLLHSNRFLTDHFETNEPEVIKQLTLKFGKVSPQPIFIGQTPTKSVEQVKEVLQLSDLKGDKENFKEVVGRHHEQCEKEFIEQPNVDLAQLKYNCEKIQFFIRQILNPIIRAVYQYEERIMNAQYLATASAISWVKFDRVQSDSSNTKTKLLGPINQEFISYTKEMFLVSESQSLSSSEEFMEIIQQIDPCVEQLSMSALFNVDFTEEHLINRTSLAIMLIVAMSAQTSNHIINEQLKRMALVGHQAINTAVILNTHLKNKGILSYKESEKQRLIALSSSNLKKQASEFSLKSLLLKNNERKSKNRETKQIIESFAGFFEVYLCFSSTYLFINDLGVVESTLEFPLQSIGEQSSDYKQKVLEEVSSHYSQIMQFENQVKTEIYSQIVETDSTSTNGPSIAQIKSNYQQALVERSIEEKKNQNSDQNNLSDAEGNEEIKEYELAQKQPQEEASSMNSLQEEFHRRGYIHKCKAILMQCFTDKSYSDNLASISEGRINLSEKSLELIQNQRDSIGLEQIDYQSMVKDVILQFNNKKFAQLGNSLLSQTLAKQHYIKTFYHQDIQQFSGHLLSLHQTKSTQKEWLGYLFCEKFFDMMTQSEDNNQLPQKAEEIKEKLQNVGYNQKESLLSKLPQMPILLDDSNIIQKENVARYQRIVFSQYSENLHRINNSDCEELKGYEEEEKVNLDFNLQQDHFVEVFSETMSALIGGIFLDSGDFQFTQDQILGLMKSQIYGDTNPFVDQERTKAIEVWNSKHYTGGQEITHVVEEKQDFIYIRIFFGKLEVRRCKFEKHKVNKVSKTYLDLRFYLENAYKQFEAKWWPKKYNLNETNVKQDHWLAFNQEYRKQYHPNKTAEISRRQYSLFKEACKQLQTDYFDEKTTSQIIMEALTKGARMQHISQDSILLALEDERSSSSKIREIFNKCGIYQINTLSAKNKDLKSWINNLSEYNFDRLYQEMETFQSMINDLVHNDGIDMESSSVASTQCNSLHY